jgi:hypothetical protein
MTTPDARVGRAVMTGDYPLPVEELAVLLAAAAHRPPTDDAAHAFVLRCWRELHRIDTALADRARVAALADGAPFEAYDAIGVAFTQPQPTQGAPA